MKDWFNREQAVWYYWCWWGHRPLSKEK